jgi:hypothetical protein
MAEGTGGIRFAILSPGFGVYSRTDGVNNTTKESKEIRGVKVH